MKRAGRLQPVRQQLEDDAQRLHVALVASQRRVAQVQAQLDELQRYHAEYQQGFSRRAGGGMGANELRDYQVFMSRLAQAIVQQKNSLVQARQDEQQQRERWQDSRRRSQAIGHVMDRWQLDEQRRRERQEQQEADQRAQRRRTPP